jgi:hypothetical protein
MTFRSSFGSYADAARFMDTLYRSGLGAKRTAVPRQRLHRHFRQRAVLRLLTGLRQSTGSRTNAVAAPIRARRKPRYTSVGHGLTVAFRLAPLAERAITG